MCCFVSTEALWVDILRLFLMALFMCFFLFFSLFNRYFFLLFLSGLVSNVKAISRHSEKLDLIVFLLLLTMNNIVSQFLCFFANINHHFQRHSSVYSCKIYSKLLLFCYKSTSNLLSNLPHIYS